MSTVSVRPFRRADREQLTALVNAHVQAVVPGLSVSVNTVMSQLERDPGEFIVDPWVTERSMLVAEQRGRVVAAAHLLRYGAGEEVGEAIRGGGDINWLLYWPEASYWPDSTAAANALMTACLAQFRRWQVTRWHADGALPAPGVYGLPEQWPHIRALYERAGFVHDGHVEIVLLARVDELPRPAAPPLEGLTLRRSVDSWKDLSAALSDLGLTLELQTDCAIGRLDQSRALSARDAISWLIGRHLTPLVVLDGRTVRILDRSEGPMLCRRLAD